MSTIEAVPAISQPAPLPAIEVASPDAAPVKSPRLVSLDVFRGVTIAAMILVNNQPDPKYWPLEHASWHGWTPTDLIFPFFLFIVGVATPFSLGKRAVGETRAGVLAHIWARALSLFDSTALASRVRASPSLCSLSASSPNPSADAGPRSAVYALEAWADPLASSRSAIAICG